MAIPMSTSRTGASISTISTSGARATKEGLLRLWAGATPSTVAIRRWLRFKFHQFGSTTTPNALGRDCIAVVYSLDLLYCWRQHSTTIKQ
jgi:hypothetical protein